MSSENIEKKNADISRPESTEGRETIAASPERGSDRLSAQTAVEQAQAMIEAATARGAERLRSLEQYNGISPDDIAEASGVVEEAGRSVLDEKGKLESRIGDVWDPNGDVPPPLPAEDAWDPNGDVPPPLPVEDVTPSTDVWDKNGDVPPPLPEESVMESHPFGDQTENDPTSPSGKESNAPKVYSQESSMKERIVRVPEILSDRDSSKRFMREERDKLATEIREARNRQREALRSLSADIHAADGAAENAETEDASYGSLALRLGKQSTEMAERLVSDPGSGEEGVRQEEENLAALLESDASLSSVKEKLARHYAEAGELSQEKFESMKKTVEQTMLRNDAFVLHEFLTNEELRHNANSNISERATLKDDLNLLVSLEPSISTSSVVPGSDHGLWGGGKLGVVLGGGDIMGVRQTDDNTHVGGVKYRDGAMSTSAEIDEKVSDRGPRGYNELVVNNPKVFGLYQGVAVGESGEMSGFKFDTRPGKQSVNAERKAEFLRIMDMAVETGMPPLVMTPDRRLYEFVSIGDDGVVTVGEEITPERVATGKAGLPEEERMKIGKEVISKNLFRNVTHQAEAKSVMADLENGIAERSSEEYMERILSGAPELSREEYVAYALDKKGNIDKFPKHLLADKAFMEEIASGDPENVYRHADETLKRDIDFVGHLYSVGEGKSQLYRLMPDELKKDASVMMMAVENGDYGSLDSSAVDIPEVWEGIINGQIGDMSADRLHADSPIGRKIFEPVYLGMRSGRENIDMTDRLLSDERFLNGLKKRYPGFSFESEGRGVMVTKLG